MKRKSTTKSIITTLLAVSMLGTLVLAGCAKKEEPSNIIGTITVNVDISAAVELEDPTALAIAEDKGGSVYSVEIGIREGDTLLTALQNAAPDIIVGTTSGSWGTYISSIDGLAEKAVTNESGWTYLINEEWSLVGADGDEVADGDIIDFTYITSYDFGDDMDAGDSVDE
ncbi:MAG: DUF4430 domain-containing protein [Coriobacteriia bacterium]|nr:DUF4430 domain-containing protein [Coriobacteriia bacterium]